MRTLTSPRVYLPVAFLLLGLVALAVRGEARGEILPSRSAFPLLALAVGINLLAVPLWAIRTQLVLRHAGHHVGLASLSLLTVFANVGNQILPAAGGEVARGAYLSTLHDVPAVSTAATLVFERLLGFLLMASTAFGAVVSLSLGLLAGTLAGATAVLMCCAGLILVSRAGDSDTHGADDGARLVRRAVRAVIRTVGQVRALAARPALLTKFTILSLGIYTVLALGFLVSASAMSVDLDPVQAWALHGSGMTMGTLSAIPFGLGASEATIATIGVWAGLSVTSTLAAAVGMRISLTLPLGVLGVAAYLALSKRLGNKLARATAEVPTTGGTE